MAATPTPPLASAVNGSPTRRVAGTGSAPGVTRTSTHHRGAPRGRAGAAVWLAVGVAALVLVGLIVFMLQNTQPVLVSFLGMEGTVPLAVSLLIAAVGVGIIALVVGTVRVAQVRRRLHRRG
ncbi:lipopolysaccharide assembly protein LapA domain-containing protein [Isoptericola sp. 4D.3]|jgi:lipopolysaccharide assembly protein A|uniref:Lipopolysaccharide assembly protein LapA domain-containing protein n=1 Tax=Isoptericola peretonis TaxID=2918523 RepID=A0ABT0J905_9MICO|nr:lipopolysaccharide assembly protein LapA domain-containing protein [Isoptericola sp. 4D.3]